MTHICFIDDTLCPDCGASAGPKYPTTKVKIDLRGPDGNAYFVMAIVKRALVRAGATSQETDLYIEESMSGDYDNLLDTATKWASVKYVGRRKRGA